MLGVAVRVLGSEGRRGTRHLSSRDDDRAARARKLSGTPMALMAQTAAGCACVVRARRQWKTYKLAKGAKFALQRKKLVAELTTEMLAK